jgi:hypothetical protein
MVSKETKKKSADPLPYIIFFSILFFVALGVLTWTLSTWYKEHQCVLYPNIWCSDNWTCNNPCPTGHTGNQCFVNLGPTGLASCIFGPNAPGSRDCLATPPGTGGLACDCPTGMQSIPNCFAGCADSFNDLTTNSQCCCCPDTAGCPWSAHGQLPPSQCGYVPGRPCQQIQT